MIEGNTEELSVELDAELLQELAEPAVEIAEDGLTNFRWREDGLFINTTGPTNAITVQQWVGSDSFEQYDVLPSDNEIVFGTPCSTITNLLQAATYDDIITLELENLTGKLGIKFTDVNYSLAGVDTDSINDPEVPNLEFDIEAIVHSSVFQRVYQVIGMVTDSIKFAISEDKFLITGRGDTDSAEIHVDLEENEEAIIDREKKNAAALYQCSQPATSRYGARFIENVNDFTPSGCFEIRLSEDYPLKVITGRAKGRIETEIIVAPRMDKDS